MTDKYRIKQELERRFNDNMKASEQYTENSKSSALFTSAAKEDYDLLAFIDSLPEEPVSEDLEEYAKKLAKGAALDKHNLIWMCKKGAEWQKQKSMQDFLEKAEMYLKTRVYYNMHPNNVTTAIQEFKNYMQNESEN
jgi:anaerobic ribonucleoside-triphosphate reductase